MQFENISPNRIKVILSPQDIAAADIRLDSSDESDIKKLKRYLLFLLTQVKAKFSSSGYDEQSLCIEFYPQSNGGATVYFIAECGSFEIYLPCVFCFYDHRNLITAAVKLFDLYGHRLFKSALYQGENRLFFIIRPFDGALSPAVNLLKEFGEHIHGEEMLAAAIEEHCKPLLKERAADMLAYYFG